jgi:hypothetical protein
MTDSNFHNNHNSPYLTFKVGIVEQARAGVRTFVEALPGGSIVGQWALGLTEEPPESPYLPVERIEASLECTKAWHQMPNPHCTFDFWWCKDGSRAVHYATAHLHQNGLEMLFKKRTAETWVRQPGQDEWAVHLPVSVCTVNLIRIRIRKRN